MPDLSSIHLLDLEINSVRKVDAGTRNPSGF
jgi:hypothetical protein